MKDDRLYLIHIGECISQIEQYTAGGRDEFLDSKLIQDAVLRNLQTLSESTQRISGDLKDQHPETDWKQISGFRNILAHNYLGVEIDRVWEIVAGELPALKSEVQAMMSEIE